MQETHHITHSTTHLKTYAVTFHHIAGRSPHLRLRPRATAVRVVTTARAGGGDGRETHRWRTNYSGGYLQQLAHAIEHFCHWHLGALPTDSVSHFNHSPG